MTVCEKVFMKKRKTFNCQKQRMVSSEHEIIVEKAMNKHSYYQSAKLNPKWKIQSDQFRSAIMCSRGGDPLQVVDDRITCQFCTRKFAEAAAKKHIPICEKQTKDKEFKKRNQRAAERAKKY